ncbi:uncharacterized protein LOC132920602 [Rhopalosiphum padi]|uniref:uncharacterized protein LOC132920602 n=1 Tax=Rhopalosiphum padi TaxID=40932 RepID=UPI00298DFDE3|nr:uncharacterized protein LOC132920602 [Rhopalosiphum padi]
MLNTDIFTQTFSCNFECPSRSRIALLLFNLFINDINLPIRETSSRELSTVITSASQQMEYIFNINVDDTDSDDSSSTEVWNDPIFRFIHYNTEYFKQRQLIQPTPELSL